MNLNMTSMLCEPEFPGVQVIFTGPNHLECAQHLKEIQDCFLLSIRYMIDQWDRGELTYVDEFDDLRRFLMLVRTMEPHSGWPEPPAEGTGEPREEDV